MGWRSPETKRLTLSAFAEGARLIGFDLETTGLHADKGDMPIEIGAACYQVRDGRLVMEDQFRQYLNPGFAIDAKITELTGISQETLDGAPREAEVIDDIACFFENTAVFAYNAPFDVSFMSRMYERHGLEFSPALTLDVLEMARDVLTKDQVQNYKLGTCVEHYGLGAGLQFHSALDDTIATARLLDVFHAEYLNMEERTGTFRPKVLSASFWEGYRGFSRIYVATSEGDLFYDIRRKEWNEKETESGLLLRLDMPYIVSEAFRITNSRDEKEFARFKGKLAV